MSSAFAEGFRQELAGPCPSTQCFCFVNCFLAFVRDFKQWWEESCHQPACPCGSRFRILLWVSAVRGGRGWCALAALGWEASPLGI